LVQQNDTSPSSSYSTITAITCPVCNKGKAITDAESGEIICSNCGIVISDKIQESNRPEWSAFSVEEMNAKSRTGVSTSLSRHDMGLATIIGKTDRDASGHKIDIAMHSRMDRLRTWDYRTQSSTHRNIRQAFNWLDVFKDKLVLSDAVVEKSAYIYRKAQERGLVRGRTISTVLAAAAYIACREMGVSKTLKDISAAGDIRHKYLSRAYRLLIVELDLKVPIVDSMKCIAKVANKVSLSEKTKRQAMSIMNDVAKNGISAGKDPMGLAATVLYLSSLKTGENITQHDISNAAGITEVTLRNRVKDLRSQLDLNN
jgi:transcription initiation factor TFIIB